MTFENNIPHSDDLCHYDKRDLKHKSQARVEAEINHWLNCTIYDEIIRHQTLGVPHVVVHVPDVWWESKSKRKLITERAKQALERLGYTVKFVDESGSDQTYCCHITWTLSKK